MLAQNLTRFTVVLVFLGFAFAIAVFRPQILPASELSTQPSPMVAETMSATPPVVTPVHEPVLTYVELLAWQENLTRQEEALAIREADMRVRLTQLEGDLEDLQAQRVTLADRLQRLAEREMVVSEAEEELQERQLVVDQRELELIAVEEQQTKRGAYLSRWGDQLAERERFCLVVLALSLILANTAIVTVSIGLSRRSSSSAAWPGTQRHPPRVAPTTRPDAEFLVGLTTAERGSATALRPLEGIDAAG